MTETQASQKLAETPLHALHVARGARMVPFAGYDMPVQYPDGILAEHVHVRAEAGLFDVSHMGQAFLIGADQKRWFRETFSILPPAVSATPSSPTRAAAFSTT